MRVSAIVLAGGDGKRFGGNKLSQYIGEKTILERVIDTLVSAGIPEIIVVISDGGNENPISHDVKIVVEEVHNLQSAVISGCKKAFYERVFLTAGDMPFLKRDAILWQLSHSGFTIPRWKKGYLEPLHSVVGKRLHQLLREGIKLGDAILASGAKPIPAELFPEFEFFNVNTREDLEKARKIVGKSPSIS